MSQYKISKKRLEEIIKEEYQSLNEDHALTRTMARRADEAKDIPKHLTVARMIEDGNLDGAIEAIQDMKVAQAAAVEVEQVPASVEAMPYNRQDEAAKPDFADLDDDGDKEEPMKKAAKEKNLKKESLDSIRDLIQQELQSL